MTGRPWPTLANGFRRRSRRDREDSGWSPKPLKQNTPFLPRPGGGPLLSVVAGDGCGVARAARVGEVGGGGGRLVADRRSGPVAGRPAVPPQHPDLAHQRDELRAVAVLAGGEDAGDGPAPPV